MGSSLCRSSMGTRLPIGRTDEGRVTTFYLLLDQCPERVHQPPPSLSQVLRPQVSDVDPRVFLAGTLRRRLCLALDASHTACVCLFHEGQSRGYSCGMSVADPLAVCPGGDQQGDLEAVDSISGATRGGGTEVYACFIIFGTFPHRSPVLLARPGCTSSNHNKESPFICAGAPSTPLMMRTTYSVVR
jgi:hypothetical protein